MSRLLGVYAALAASHHRARLSFPRSTSGHAPHWCCCCCGTRCGEPEITSHEPSARSSPRPQQVTTARGWPFGAALSLSLNALAMALFWYTMRRAGDHIP